MSSKTFEKMFCWLTSQKVELFGKFTLCYIWCETNTTFLKKNVLPRVDIVVVLGLLVLLHDLQQLAIIDGSMISAL